MLRLVLLNNYLLLYLLVRKINNFIGIHSSPNCSTCTLPSVFIVGWIQGVAYDHVAFWGNVISDVHGQILPQKEC